MSNIVYWCFVIFACFNAVIALFLLIASVIKYFMDDNETDL